MLLLFVCCTAPAAAPFEFDFEEAQLTEQNVRDLVYEVDAILPSRHVRLVLWLLERHAVPAVWCELALVTTAVWHASWQVLLPSFFVRRDRTDSFDT